MAGLEDYFNSISRNGEILRQSTEWTYVLSQQENIANALNNAVVPNESLFFSKPSC